VTPLQYRHALAALDLTQGEAARLFDLSLRTSNAYASGELTVPVPVAMVLKLLVTGKIKLEDLT
jgi:hypothetical protein